MSFGSQIRFQPDKKNRPLVFWDFGKERKTSRKFSYKTRDQRFPVRHNHLEDHCEHCQHSKLHRHDHKFHTSKNFIKKNITKIQNRNPANRNNEKPFVNNVINRCSPHRRRTNDTLTLTDTQLNALLEAVRNMSPESNNSIKFKLDGQMREIQVNSENPDKTGDDRDDIPVTKEITAPPDIHANLPRPRGVDRSGMFDGGSLSPILDEVESNFDDDDPSGASNSKQEERSRKLEVEHPTSHTKLMTIPSATVSMSNWSDPGSSVELPPLVPRAHLTLAEKKRPQWARERDELHSCYDPWKRGGVKTSRSVSRAGSILTDYPVTCAMDDENRVLQKIQERTKWLTELEKQRAEQRLERFERKQQEREAYHNSFIDHFSKDRKPAPLPSQINIQKDRSMVTMMPSRLYP